MKNKLTHEGNKFTRSTYQKVDLMLIVYKIGIAPKSTHKVLQIRNIAKAGIYNKYIINSAINTGKLIILEQIGHICNAITQGAIFSMIAGS